MSGERDEEQRREKRRLNLGFELTNLIDRRVRRPQRAASRAHQRLRRGDADADADGEKQSETERRWI